MSTETSNGNNGLVKRMRDLWTRIEPGTDDVVLMTQVSAILAEAAFRLERLEGEHENITRGRLPTHRCTVCDTFWMDLPEHKAMTMVGIMCGDVCCIGSNVEKLPAIRGSSETFDALTEAHCYEGEKDYQIDQLLDYLHYDPGTRSHPDWVARAQAAEAELNKAKRCVGCGGTLVLPDRCDDCSSQKAEVCGSHGERSVIGCELPKGHPGLCDYEDPRADWEKEGPSEGK